MSQTDVFRPLDFNPYQPKAKKDWAGKMLRLLEACPEPCRLGYGKEAGDMLPAGSVVRITRRLNAGDTIHTAHDISSWGPVRALQISWTCPFCKTIHLGYIPEGWIEQGKAEFSAPGTPPLVAARTVEELAFLRGVMAVCAALARDDQPGLAYKMAASYGYWEDYRDADCDIHDLRAFAISEGQDAIRRLRRGRPGHAR